VTNSRVQVLLSTYNGQKYLNELLEGVLNQDFPNVQVLARDDGSTDGTLAVLRRYATRENVRVMQGENLGVVGSFFALLAESSPDVEFIALCDQDDVWLPGKVAAAVDMLAQLNEQKPLLYCSRVEFVDRDLGSLGFTEAYREPGFSNAVVENIATGCTIVINQATRKLVLSSLPRWALMHDWWLYLVVSAFGEVVYDRRSFIKYRQHAANAVGGTPDFLKDFLRRLKRFLAPQNSNYRISGQAEEFLRCFGPDLESPEKELLQRFLASRKSWRSRLQYALKPEVYRHSPFYNALLRLLILWGRY